MARKWFIKGKSILPKDIVDSSLEAVDSILQEHKKIYGEKLQTQSKLLHDITGIYTKIKDISDETKQTLAEISAPSEAPELPKEKKRRTRIGRKR